MLERSLLYVDGYLHVAILIPSLVLQRELQTWYQNCEMRTVILSSSEGEGGHDPYWFEGGKNIVAQTSVSTS